MVGCFSSSSTLGSGAVLPAAALSVDADLPGCCFVVPGGFDETTNWHSVFGSLLYMVPKMFTCGVRGGHQISQRKISNPR